MAVSFDLNPTDRLSGIHMIGMVERRFLISYPVPPESLSHYLPPGAELSLYEEHAWVSACFVHMTGMRPNFMPKLVGMEFNYLIFRTRAKLPFPDGQLREAVLVLQPNMNRRFLSKSGSLFTGVGFQYREINFTEDEEHWFVNMKQKDQLLFDARILKSSCSELIATESCFPDAETADDFLLGVSFGGQWVEGEPVLKLLPETHEPWVTQTCQTVTRKNEFLESLGVSPVESDHTITMSHIPHYFGITPVKSALKKEARLQQEK